MGNLKTRPCWAVVLAGGDGKRLREYMALRWGFRLPKQFCSFNSEGSLVDQTVGRMRRVIPAEQIVVTLRTGQREVAAVQLARHPVRIVAEPENVDTTAAIYLSLLHIHHDCPDATVVVVPSDHFVSPVEPFLAAVRRAADIAATNDGVIAVVGAEPTCEDRDLGLIIPQGGDGGDVSGQGHGVAAFLEKPSSAEMQYVQHRGAFWSTFVMAGTIRAFWSVGRQTVPQVIDAIEGILPSIGTEEESQAIAGAFARIPSSNFSRDVLPHIPGRLRLIPLNGCDWLDLGCPDRLERALRLMRRRTPHGPDRHLCRVRGIRMAPQFAGDGV